VESRSPAGSRPLRFGAVVDGIFVGITQVVALEADPGVIRTPYDIDAFLTGRVFWVLLGRVPPLLLAGWRGALPRWTVWLNTVVAILFVLGGVSVEPQGAFSPYSAVPFPRLHPGRERRALAGAGDG
jgi:hypothetical protein